MDTDLENYALYLGNVADLIIALTRQPVTKETIQKSRDYKAALDAVYPLIAEKLTDYYLQPETLEIPREEPLYSNTPTRYPPIGTRGFLRYKSGETDPFVVQEVKSNGKNLILRGQDMGLLEVTWRGGNLWIPKGKSKAEGANFVNFNPY